MLLWQVPVELHGSILLVVSRSCRQVALTAADERDVQALGWVGDYFSLWCQQRHDQRRADWLRGAFDRVGTAMLVLDGDARVIGINGAAQVILDTGDGLLRRGDRLTAAVFTDAVRLHSAIGHALAAPAAGLPAALLAIQRKKRRPLILMVLCVASQPAAGEAAVMLQLVEPDRNHDAAMTATCTLLGLNGAETRLTTLLASGASLTEAATTLRIKLPTARGLPQTSLRENRHKAPGSVGPFAGVQPFASRPWRGTADPVRTIGRPSSGEDRLPHHRAANDSEPAAISKPPWIARQQRTMIAFRW